MRKDLHKKVATVLQEYPRSRDDDFFLIAVLYRKYYNVAALPFFDVMTNIKGLALPSPESITRIRRRLQEQSPLIYGASGQVRKERAKLEEEYRQFFRG